MSPPAVEKILHSARTRLSRGDARGAEAICREALESAPDDPKVVALLGRTLLAQQRHADAGAVLARAIALDPRNGEAHRDLGEVLIASGRPEAAMPILFRAQDLLNASDPGLDALLVRARDEAARRGMMVARDPAKEGHDRGRTVITFVGRPPASAEADERTVVALGSAPAAALDGQETVAATAPGDEEVVSDLDLKTAMHTGDGLGDALPPASGGAEASEATVLYDAGQDRTEMWERPDLGRSGSEAAAPVAAAVPPAPPPEAVGPAKAESEARAKSGAKPEGGTGAEPGPRAKRRTKAKSGVESKGSAAGGSKAEASAPPAGSAESKAPAPDEKRGAAAASKARKAVTGAFKTAQKLEDGRVGLSVDDVLAAIIDGGVLEENSEVRDRRERIRAGQSGRSLRLRPAVVVALAVLGALAGFVVTRVDEQQRSLETKALSEAAAELFRDTEPGYHHALDTLQHIPGAEAAVARALAHAALASDFGGGRAHFDAALEELKRTEGPDRLRAEAIAARVLLHSAAAEHAWEAPPAAEVEAVVGTAGELSEAVRELLARAPDSFLAPTAAGRHHLAQGRTAEGLTFLLEALQRDPGYPLAQRALARFAGDLGDLARARRHIDALLRRDAEDLFARSDRALLLPAVGEPVSETDRERVEEAAARGAADAPVTSVRASLVAAALQAVERQHAKVRSRLSKFEAPRPWLEQAAALLLAIGETKAARSLAERLGKSAEGDPFAATVAALADAIDALPAAEVPEEPAAGDGRTIHLLYGRLRPRPGRPVPFQVEWDARLPDLSAVAKAEDPAAAAQAALSRWRAERALSTGAWQEAIEILKGGAPGDATSGGARVDLARAYLQAGKAEEALATLAQARPLDPSTPQGAAALSLRAEAALRLGREAEAREALEALSKAGIASPSLLRMQARAQLTAGRADRALALLDEALRLAPGDPRLAFTRGQVLHALGREAEAEAAFVAAAKAAPEHFETEAGAEATEVALGLFYLGHAAEAAGREAEAIERYRRALELDPSLAPACFHLGRLEMVQGQKSEAKRHLECYLDAAPSGLYRGAARAMLKKLR
ncbi:MAG: tetratricopeptide repeat protein [Deltaproteobacteria bacterium]|nr:MAG: tetratricopeptide repeat protein [Deltaproteobacteria bacterium]